MAKPAPIIDDQGAYVVDTFGQLADLDPNRQIRVWTQLDCGLLMRDLYAKLARSLETTPGTTLHKLPETCCRFRTYFANVRAATAGSVAFLR